MQITQTAGLSNEALSTAHTNMVAALVTATIIAVALLASTRMTRFADSRLSATARKNGGITTLVIAATLAVTFYAILLPAALADRGNQAAADTLGLFATICSEMICTPILLAAVLTMVTLLVGIIFSALTELWKAIKTVALMAVTELRAK